MTKCTLNMIPEEVAAHVAGKRYRNLEKLATGKGNGKDDVGDVEEDVDGSDTAVGEGAEEVHSSILFMDDNDTVSRPVVETVSASSGEGTSKRVGNCAGAGRLQPKKRRKAAPP